MPIKARTDMLSTGIRTPIGIKVFGKDLDEMEKLAKQIETVVKGVPGTTSAFAERITGGFYLNIEPDREQLARYGLSVGEVLDVIGTALGGEMVTTTVEGRERYGVSVRYPRELRSDPQQIAREVLVPTMEGAMIPLGQVAKVVVAKGAPGIRTENALLSAYIYVDIRDRDIGGYVADAKKAVAAAGEVSTRLLRDLERAVRVHGARHRENEDRDPVHAAVHLPAAVPELPPHHRDPDRDAVGALCAGGRCVADVAA
jgi:Cu(I)/Ag(I) efflux system membrane protein CusA/SilA